MVAVVAADFRSTGVKPSCERTLRPTSFLVFRGESTTRNRGLMNSSIPKLISARLVPSSAMATPGGMYHHQNPDSTAEDEVASNSIVPQL